jgi:hypothetical protein
MNAIEYKAVKSVKKLDATHDYLVRVELSEKPDEEWLEAFFDNCRRSLPCPACRPEGADLVFISGAAAIRGRVLGLKRVIHRTNMDFAAIKEAPMAIPVKATDEPTAEQIEEMLKREGL